MKEHVGDLISPIIAVLSLLIVTNAYASNNPSNRDKVSIYSMEYIYGKYEMPIMNDGRFGYDPSYNVPGGTRWPQGSNDGYLFGAGIWIGAIVDSAKHVDVGFNPENIETELVPGAPPNHGYTNPAKRVYISTDYPNDGLPTWPLGYNSDGTPKTVSQMDSWCQFNDLDTTHQFEGGLPLGCVVTLHTYSWNSSYRNVQDIAFLDYWIKNIRPDHKTWHDAYVGIAWDPDIGDPTKNINSAIPDLNLGYAYSPLPEDSYEQSLDYPPGLIGLQFLDAPVKDPVTGEGKLTTSFIWSGENNPNNDDRRYDMMASGEMDTTEGQPGDTYQILCNGPFNLAYGDSAEFVVAVCFAEPDWYYNPSLKGTEDGGPYDNHLIQVAQNALYIYKHNYLFPEPPSLPYLTLIPEDQKMIVTWDKSSESSEEPVTALPTTNPHNFAGYRLYKSVTGLPGSFQLLGDWHLDFNNNGDSIGNNLVHSYIDTGLTDGKTYFYAVTAYSKGEYPPGDYGDSVDEVVPSLETGMVLGRNMETGIPEPPPSNFTSPGLSNYTITSEDSTSLHLGVTPDYLVADSVKAGQYKLEFGSPPDIRIDLTTAVQGPNIYVINTSTGDTVSTTLNFPITDPPTNASSGYFDGMELNYTGPNLAGNHIDTVYFTQPRPQVVIQAATTFSGDYFTPQTAIIRQPPLAFFFRPHKYLVYFQTPQLVYVYDMTTGKQLGFALRTLGQDYGVASYVGTPTIDPTTGDTTWTWSNSPSDFKRYPDQSDIAYKFYLPGVFVFVEDVHHTIQAGDSLIVDLSGQSSPRAGDTISFNVIGSKINYHSNLSVIKVVPNPYLVRAPWDLDNDYQRIAFINLPTQCTIRIFTVAGDLVQTIQHSEPYPGGFSTQSAGTAYWNLQTRNNQKISTGVYIYYVTSPFGTTVGRFAVIR